MWSTQACYETFRYVNCVDRRGHLEPDELRLLQEGAAVAIFVQLVDAFDGQDPAGVVERCERYLEAGHLEHLPQGEVVLRQAVAGGSDPVQVSGAIFEAYVATFFRDALR